MKKRLLELIVCPVCKLDLSLTAQQQEQEEIIEGSLHCSNNHRFVITGGIPKFVSSDSYAGSFGFQWNAFSQVQLDCFNHTTESEETFLEKTAFDPNALAGRLVLDAGTGAGRFADVVSRFGAEVVGVDLSSAIDAAYRNIGNRTNTHLVQADILHLPFREGTFDFAFSIGVLHHTPDTRRAFESLVPFLKKNGEIAIWVYSRHSESRKISDLLRRITVRVPGRLLFYLSTIAIPLYYLKPLRTIFQGVFKLCMHKNWRWRWLDTFDYFSPKYQWKHTYSEVFSWFHESGLTDITPLNAPVSMKGRMGLESRG